MEEACHPVPMSAEDLLKYMVLISGNVGSAVLHGDIIREWQAHAAALQEVKCDQAQLVAQYWECRKTGWTWTAGEALQRKSRANDKTVGSDGDIGCGGSAIMTRDTLTQRKIRPKDDAERELFDAGRWCASGIPIAQAVTNLILHNFYGVSGNSLAKRRENERWLKILLGILARTGKSLPVVCCMDSNVVIDNHDALQQFFRDHGFQEAAYLHHRPGGEPPSRRTL